MRVAEEDLQAANLLLEVNSYRGADDRAYYAIFHAVSAVIGFTEYRRKAENKMVKKTA